MEHKFWIVNKLDDTTAELLIYGYIGDEVTAGAFIRELKQLEKIYSEIHIRINSGGGSIFEGIAIINAIQNSKSEIIGYIDGIAASMASVIAVACKKIYMSRFAMLMTHRASGIAAGNANDLRTYASLMEGLEDTIAGLYASKTGLSKEDAKTKYLAGEDRWLTAEAAVTEKLIDGIYDLDDIEVEVPVSMTAPKQLVNFFNTKMKLENKIYNMTPAVLAILKLPANADSQAIENAIRVLASEAAKVPALTKEKEAAETALSTFKSATVTKEVKAIIAEALNGGKFTKEVSEKLEAKYADNPTELRDLVDAMPAFTSITSQLKSNGKNIENMADKTWDELDKAGTLEDLKASDIDLFKAKFKQKFNKEYTA